jgi:hypothetical protein
MSLMHLKAFSVLILIALAGPSNSQSLRTVKYAGIYMFGGKVDEGPSGRVTIFPETDSTLLFFVDISLGPPSYNLGQLYSRILIKNNDLIYFSKESYDQKGCKWKLTFEGDVLTIKTLDDCYECGFGSNVYADKRYTRKSEGIPQYFIDGHGAKIYFKDTGPEAYQK